MLQLLVGVIDPTPTGAATAAEVREGVGHCAEVVHAASVPEFIAAVDAHASSRLGPDHTLAVPVLFLTDEVGALDDVATTLIAQPPIARARIVLMTSRNQLDDVTLALDKEWCKEIIARPWTRGALTHRSAAHLRRWLSRFFPNDPRIASLTFLAEPATEPTSRLLTGLTQDMQVLTSRFISACERVLGPRPRLHVPAGVRLTHQGETVTGVYIVINGSVALTRQTHVGEVTLHHATTGRIVGLLSLSAHATALVTSTTTTPCELISLSVEQLDRSLSEDAATGEALAALLIQSLSRRLARAEVLQIEKEELAAQLDGERRELAQALDDLEAAHAELMAQERFATLGELSAGIAHELNNPVVAMQRAIDHIDGQVRQLLSSHPRAGAILDAATRGQEAVALSSRDERALVRELTAAAGDRETARRMVRAGIHTEAEIAKLRAVPGDFPLIEAASAWGRSARALHLAASQIRELVSSLHSYARPVGAAQEPMDIATSIEDALTLVSHRVAGVRLVRDYQSVPLITGNAGELAHVWTNILSNAGDATTGRQGEDAGVSDPRIAIHIEPGPQGFVRVRIVDNGPGIAPELLDRIFEPRFTTKGGKVKYGLGLGMGLAKAVVDHHHGDISVSSEPGNTQVTVDLPAAT